MWTPPAQDRIESSWTPPADEAIDDSIGSKLKGFSDKVTGALNTVSDIAKPYTESQLGSPQQLLGAAQEGISKLASKGGEFAAENMALEGASPNLAAGVGTAISMGPDIAQAFINPEVAAGATPKPRLVDDLLREAPPKSSFENLANAAKEKIPPIVKEPMQQVNDYIAKEYKNVAKQPGAADIAANYLKEHSQNMILKDAGASPGQVRKISVERAHDLADYMEKNGLTGTTIGSQGRERLIKQRLEESGGAVGAFRKMATDRGAVHDINELINQVQSNLDNKYLVKGMYSGQKGSYLKALEELKKTDGTAQAMADKVTEMFKEAKSQNPLNMPTGPLADVARQVRSINQDMISKALTPEEMALYEKSLEDYGALTQINEFVKRKSSTDAGGRLGPGSGISRAAVQKFLDAFGYRTEGKIAGKLADWIRKNPGMLTKPKDIFRQYIDEAAEAVHEMGDATH